MPGLVWPNGGSLPAVSSEYGMRFHPIDKVWRLHGGIDLVGWSEVRSPVDGVVVYAGYNGGFGNLVKVRAANGDEFWMAHNARFLVGYGARVVAGQGVAIMGTTGASTGVHCHYETRPGGGSPVNPRDYFAGAAGGGSNPYNPEEDMDANDKAIAAQTSKDVGIIKQLLTETEQWKGIGAVVSETLQNVGVIRQLLTETEQWKGIGFLVSKTYETVTSLAAAVAEIANRTDDTEIDPAIIAELRAAVTDLAAIDFPTEASIVDAVDAAAQRARIDELEAELARLKA